MLWLAVPLVYNVVAIVLAVFAPRPAGGSALRDRTADGRDRTCYLATVLLSLTLVPLAVSFAFYFSGAGAFAFPLWVAFAWPGMLALLLRTLAETVAGRRSRTDGPG